MLTTISDKLINYGAAATMLLGIYALYLCLTYSPSRRKR